MRYDASSTSLPTHRPRLRFAHPPPMSLVLTLHPCHVGSEDPSAWSHAKCTLDASDHLCL